MKRFASVLCFFVLTATSFGATAVCAQTLHVGLTIVAANGAGATNPIRKSGQKANGHVRIVEYVSPGYAASPKPRNRASTASLK